MNDSYDVNEDSALNTPAPGVLTNDLDGENNVLTAQLQTSPAHAASFTLNADGSFSYTPNPDFNGSDSFTYSASDRSFSSNAATVTITVNAVNDIPNAVGDSATVTEDSGANAINVLSNDDDASDTGETLTITAVTQGATGSVVITNGGAGVSYTPNANFSGSDSFTYTISDGNGGTDMATVNVTVTPVNDSPTINFGTITRQEAAGTSNSQISAVNDIDDVENNLVVTVNNSTSATTGGVTVSNIAVDTVGNVTADVSAACGASNAAFTLKVADPGNSTATAAFHVTVTLETNPPSIASISNIVVILPANSPATSMVVTFPLPTATDNCSVPTVSSNPVSGSLFNVGTTAVSVTATDGNGNTTTSSFIVTVLYNFAGFFQPIDNLPTVNVVKAGRATPLKFSLSGDKGLAILATGYPISIPVACDATEQDSTLEEAVNSGGSSLSYNSMTDQYAYVWKTNKSWKGTCRIFVIKLTDGSEHYAKFRFT